MSSATKDIAPEEHTIIRSALEQGTTLSDLTILMLEPSPPPGDYREAMDIATTEAGKRLNEPMLISWYDRDRDFESPQHASECHLESAVPGYVDYGINHGARLMIDVDSGRFIFFYLAVDL